MNERGRPAGIVSQRCERMALRRELRILLRAMDRMEDLANASDRAANEADTAKAAA